MVQLGMNQRVVWIVVAAVAAVAVLAWLLLLGGGPPPLDEEIADGQPPTPTPAPEQRIILLFLAGDGLLHPELRIVRLPVEVEERIRVVMTELLAGPQEEAANGSIAAPTQRRRRLVSVFPYKAELRGVYVDSNHNAFIALSPPPAPLTGSHTELLLAYGVVDSILLNCPELTGVQLLFDGAEVSSLTGHLDLSKPLSLNKYFIVAS